MSAASLKARTDTDANRTAEVIDCCVHHAWSSVAEVLEYLPKGWREYVAENVVPEWSKVIREGGPPPSSPLAYPPMTPSSVYQRPAGERLSGSGVSVRLGDRAGSMQVVDYDAMIAEHLIPNHVQRALLLPEFGMRIPTIPMPRVAAELIRAGNDWLVERWLERGDDRLYGTIVAPSQLPNVAAQEIRRLGGHRQVVAVAMAANPFDTPLGHPVYAPIYEAAAEHDLVVVIHAGGAAAPERIESVAAAGPPASFSAYYSLLPQSLMSYVASIISQGHLERYPGLRFLLVGAGAAWAVPFLWRFDTEFKGMRVEAPWLERLPSECFRESFRLATYPLDPAPSAEQRQRYYDALPGLDELLCYASGYPNWDTSSRETIAQALPDAWHDKVFAGNARRFFAWGGGTSAETHPTQRQSGKG